MSASLFEEVRNVLIAGCPLIHIESHDYAALLGELRKLGANDDREQGGVPRGLSLSVRLFDLHCGDRNVLDQPSAVKAAAGPLDAFRRLFEAAPEFTGIAVDTAFDIEPDAEPDIRLQVLIVLNMHHVVQSSPGIVSACIHNIRNQTLGAFTTGQTAKVLADEAYGYSAYESPGKFIIAVTPLGVRLPADLSSHFVPLVHGLPSAAELRTKLETIANFAREMTEEEKTSIAQSGVGLTGDQFANTVARLAIANNRNPPTSQQVWDAKSEVLNAGKLLRVLRPEGGFDTLAGLTGAKNLLLRLLDPVNRTTGDNRPLGVAFAGPPGVGKSAIVGALGHETGLRVLAVNPGDWLGGVVGETEANMRKALEVIRAHAPVIVLVDEIEKVMPSANAARANSNVDTRLIGSFLSFMSENRDFIFWCFTANDIESMQTSALFRSERLDFIAYVGMPDAVQRAAIWSIYLKKFLKLSFDRTKPPTKFADIDAAFAYWLSAPDRAAARLELETLGMGAAATLLDDTAYSPADIKTICRHASLLREPIRVAMRRVSPLGKTAAEEIQKVEAWARNRAIDANTGEIYGAPPAKDRDATKAPNGTPKRRLGAAKPDVN